MTILAILIGGSIGAISRYGLMTFLSSYGVISTLMINILGSFILGFFIELSSLYGSTSQIFKSFLVIGVLGSFTTFSTFSLDTVTLYQKGAIFHSVAYVVGSTTLSIGALFLGLSFMKLFSS